MSVFTTENMTRKQLDDAARNSQITNIINHMNDVWSDGRSGWFNICVVMTLAEHVKYPHSSKQYGILRPYHCISWRKISSETRTQLAMVTLSLFNIPEVGYDTRSEKFVDVRFDAQFHKKKKEMAKLVHDTEDAEIIEVEDLSSEPKLNWFKSLIKRLLKL